MRLRKWQAEWCIYSPLTGAYWSDVRPTFFTEKGALRHAQGVQDLDPKFVLGWRVKRLGS